MMCPTTLFVLHIRCGPQLRNLFPEQSLDYEASKRQKRQKTLKRSKRTVSTIGLAFGEELFKQKGGPDPFAVFLQNWLFT